MKTLQKRELVRSPFPEMALLLFCKSAPSITSNQFTITLHKLIIPDAHNEEERDPCGGNQTLF